MVAGASTIATAVTYIGYAAIGAADDNMQNIACIDHTKQYFVCKSIQLWLNISAIIALIYVYGTGGGDGCDGCRDDGIDEMDIWEHGVGVGNGNDNGNGDGCMDVIWDNDAMPWHDDAWFDVVMMMIKT